MLSIYVNLSANPLVCDTCGRKIKTGHRVVTNGKQNFDTCECEKEYDEV